MVFAIAKEACKRKNNKTRADDEGGLGAKFVEG